MTQKSEVSTNTSPKPAYAPSVELACLGQALKNALTKAQYQRVQDEMKRLYELAGLINSNPKH